MVNIGYKRTDVKNWTQCRFYLEPMLSLVRQHWFCLELMLILARQYRFFVKLMLCFTQNLKHIDSHFISAVVPKPVTLSLCQNVFRSCLSPLLLVSLCPLSSCQSSYPQFRCPKPLGASLCGQTLLSPHLSSILLLVSSSKILFMAKLFKTLCLYILHTCNVVYP